MFTAFAKSKSMAFPFVLGIIVGLATGWGVRDSLAEYMFGKAERVRLTDDVRVYVSDDFQRRNRTLQVDLGKGTIGELRQVGTLQRLTIFVSFAEKVVPVERVDPDMKPARVVDVEFGKRLPRDGSP